MAQQDNDALLAAARTARAAFTDLVFEAMRATGMAEADAEGEVADWLVSPDTGRVGQIVLRALDEMKQQALAEVTREHKRDLLLNQ